jgi:hypothetical protein
VVLLLPLALDLGHLRERNRNQSPNQSPLTSLSLSLNPNPNPPTNLNLSLSLNPNPSPFDRHQEEGDHRLEEGEHLLVLEFRHEQQPDPSIPLGLPALHFILRTVVFILLASIDLKGDSITSRILSTMKKGDLLLKTI